jgi:hypothetical protein
MEVVVSKATRRSTRVRVEIPVSVISLDRHRPFGDRCTILVVSAQGCGFRTSEALHIGTPIMLSDLPGGGSVTGQVASCVPLGDGDQYYLVGASLYTHGNVWGIENPPEDWKVAAQTAPEPAQAKDTAAPALKVGKKSWPYNLFDSSNEAHPGRR